MRKWIPLLLFVALLSCSRKEVSLLDVVPANAEIIVESDDSTVIMLFDSTHTDGGGGGKASDVRDATLRDYDKWA